MGEVVVGGEGGKEEEGKEDKEDKEDKDERHWNGDHCYYYNTEGEEEVVA